MGGDPSAVLADLDRGLAWLPEEENLLFLQAGPASRPGRRRRAGRELVRSPLAARPTLAVIARSYGSKGLMTLPDGVDIDDLLDGASRRPVTAVGGRPVAQSRKFVNCSGTPKSVLERGDHRLQVVALLAGDPQLIALRLVLDALEAEALDELAELAGLVAEMPACERDRLADAVPSAASSTLP